MYLSPNITLPTAISIWRSNLHYSITDFVSSLAEDFLSCYELRFQIVFFPTAIPLTMQFNSPSHDKILSATSYKTFSQEFILFWNDIQISVFHQIFNTNWFFTVLVTGILKSKSIFFSSLFFFNAQNLFSY